MAKSIMFSTFLFKLGVQDGPSSTSLSLTSRSLLYTTALQLAANLCGVSRSLYSSMVKLLQQFCRQTLYFLLYVRNWWRGSSSRIFLRELE